MQDLFTAIQTLGFPIAACAAMAWYVKYITDTNNQLMTEQNTRHHEELTQVSNALNNNTLALQHLTDVLALRGITDDEDSERGT